LVRIRSVGGLGAGDKFIKLAFRESRGLADAVSPLHRSVQAIEPQDIRV